MSELLRNAFEASQLMKGSLFKRRADNPDLYWDGNVQDDWELWQAALTAANERIRGLETTNAKLANSELLDAYQALQEDYATERLVSDKLEKALKDIRWQVLKDSNVDIIAEAALAEVASIRGK